MAKNMSRIYIGRLSYQAREKDVERFFRGFGRIRDINLKNGFGFVEFDDPRDADDAVYELNGRELLGERVIVEHSRGTSSGYGRRYSGAGGGGGYSDRGGGRSRGGGARSWLDKYGPPTRTDYRILVENISSRVSWQDLKDFMRSAGEITFADAHKQRVGEGVVEYASYDDMKNAMKKLDGAELNGRRLKLIEDYRGSKRRSRSGSRSRDRDRDRDRSRSHSRGRDRSRSRSRGKSRSRSRSKERSRSRDRSHSNERDDHNRSRSKSHSRSKSRSPVRDDRSRSRSRSRDRDEEPGENGEMAQRADSPHQSRSRSGSRDRSRSRSPENKSPQRDEEMRSRSTSPARNDEE